MSSGASQPRRIAHLRSGAIAGAASALAFTALHDLVISDIWDSLMAMLIAGALSGLCVGWTYGLLFKTPSLNTWARYNLIYVGLFVLLGAVSEALFTPRTTIAALIIADEPPTALIADGLPMTVVFTVAASVAITAMWGRQWSRFFAVLLTFTVLVATLGLNISILGFVEIPSSSLYLVAELLGLILVLDVVYLAVFAAVEWRTFASSLPARNEAS